MRSLMWAKSVHDDCIFSEVDWWGRPKGCKLGRKLGRDKDCVWDHLPTVVEKVAGCRGVLRDEKGVVSASFSSKCGACRVEQAVVMAVKFATEMWKQH
ncbi:hypothetical protein PVK06_013314 [Gossypium arboreum]|uniref:RNase H type-1 domain-containing protein n=1 Tax=Gossypium arboreum TaxID=29729 RepID=A0ABR0QDV1_GOSAR|nr:hypothetical protein PVK06_013314 [Gossypium arboreum]